MNTYYNDIDPYCCKVLNKNIVAGNLPKGYVDERDITTIDTNELVGYSHIHLFAGIGGFPLGLLRAGVPHTIRILTGGFPCQDISNAGKKAGIEGEKSGLWAEMYRLICDLRPDYVAVENVAALINRGLSRVLADLAQAGYDAEWCVLRASDFGAPHQRERVFIVAYPQHGRREGGMCDEDQPGATLRSGGTEARTEPQPGVGRGTDGLSARLDRYRWPAGPGGQQYSWEPARAVTGKQPHRVARIKALGNSIVPQCAEYIGRCIVQHMEDGSRGVA